MFQPKRLLKVMSVIFIILGVLGLIGTGFSYAMLPKLEAIEGMDMSLLTETMTPLNLVISIISYISSVGAGIVGISGRSRRWAVIFIGIYSLLVIVSLVQTAMLGLFGFTAVVDIIIPLLYWWGLYQSDDLSGMER